jgi:dihydroneopterin aldolase
MKYFGEIHLEQMSFHAYHGCLETERKYGNLFTVDFKGSMDMTKAGASDNLEDTVNYGEIYDIVAKEMEQPSNLLEHVCARIVKKIAGSFPEFVEFSVCVSKQNPPVGGPTKWSRVTINHKADE